LKNDILFQLYCYAIQLVKGSADVNFQEYEKLLFEHWSQIERMDLLCLYYSGLNYAIRQNNLGIKFYSTILNWYKKGLKEGLLINSGRITIMTFANIVIFAGMNNEIDWVQQFINDYQQYLPPEIREQEVLFAKARIHFYKKEYDLTIDLMNQVSLDTSKIFVAKNMIIRCYFELFMKDDTYYSLFENYAKSYEHFLMTDKKWTHKKKQPNLLFCRIIKKLAKRYYQGDKESDILEWLGKQIATDAKFSRSKWFKERFFNIL